MYNLLNFIHYYKKFYVLPLYLMENGKLFKVIAPLPLDAGIHN